MTEPFEQPNINKLAKAICDMQQPKSASALFSSNYADISAMLSVIQTSLKSNGLSIVQTTEPSDDGEAVSCRETVDVHTPTIEHDAVPAPDKKQSKSEKKLDYFWGAE